MTTIKSIISLNQDQSSQGHQNLNQNSDLITSQQKTRRYFCSLAAPTKASEN